MLHPTKDIEKKEEKQRITFSEAKPIVESNTAEQRETLKKSVLTCDICGITKMFTPIELLKHRKECLANQSKSQTKFSI